MIETNFKYKTWKFPGGEIGVKLDDLAPQDSVIVWMVEPDKTHEEFFEVANLVNACKRTGDKVTLRLSYLPYARQDRACNPGESEARFVFERMLATLEIDHIVLFDVHSKSAFTHYNKAINVEHFEQVDLVPHLQVCYDCIIAPDKGAVEKAGKIAELWNKPLIVLEKERVDGKVIHKPLKPTLVGYYNALLVDDICDGGATFISAAQAIRQHNPRHFHNIDLWVTHGIFSKGVDELRKHFGRISCYNLMNKEMVSKVQFNVSPYKERS